MASGEETNRITIDSVKHLIGIVDKASLHDRELNEFRMRLVWLVWLSENYITPEVVEDETYNALAERLQHEHPGRYQKFQTLVRLGVIK